MCGRFTITVDRVDAILQKFNAGVSPDFSDYKPRYNVAPEQFVPAIVAREDGRRLLTNIFWLLTPPWADKEGSKFAGQINVRDDTIDRNKYFRTLLLNQRCIFVADGFYEWQMPEGMQGKPLPKGVRKTPYRIRLADEGIIPLAGLWRASGEGEKKILTGAIITTGPNTLMTRIHNRMPVILPDEALDHWLDPSFKEFDQLRAYLAPYSAAGLDAYVVSTAVNNSRLDTPACIEADRP